ncbi:CDP-diacylglycerol--glycerol-3-phosphate 3-phosphatidyltransferase [Candidatus Desulfarcum epimagneticum]|uniref:CDP-diacylglycerol--glycerol-3-phosphate 3-phosphatidyltransferase n=1 Tax=uncultured Desulfobacteraceae bacterium TaxID=218296 RepID=A0A484HCT4_9BACT|nr:CDP-diacylglycerol--glycerol-3-phosphate 3-phosphatidyltransferase [uncultured Desulfobacteraceae bacterium]
MISKEKVKTIAGHPNFLTLFRIAACPAIVVLLLFPNRFFTLVATLLFSLAAITDFLDGFVARRRGLVSHFGKLMDPLADKLLISCSFIMISSHGWIPAWVVCVIVGRELAVTGLRNFISGSSMEADVSASKLGKYKTGFQIAAIIPLLIHFPYFGINFNAIGMALLWAALGMTIWSGVAYFIQFRGLLFEK